MAAWQGSFAGSSVGVWCCGWDSSLYASFLFIYLLFGLYTGNTSVAELVGLIGKRWRWVTGVCATCAELLTHPGWIIRFSPYECWDRFQYPLWAWLGITYSYQKRRGGFSFMRTTVQISSVSFINSPLSKILFIIDITNQTNNHSIIMK